MSRIARITRVYVPLSLFSSLLVTAHAKDPSSNTDSTTALKSLSLSAQEVQISKLFAISQNPSRFSIFL